MYIQHGSDYTLYISLPYNTRATKNFLQTALIPASGPLIGARPPPLLDLANSSSWRASTASRVNQTKGTMCRRRSL